MGYACTNVSKLNTMPLKYLDGHAHGDIISRLVNDVDQVADGLLQGFTQFFTGIVTIVGTIIFMLTISPLITLVVVIDYTVVHFCCSLYRKAVP